MAASGSGTKADPWIVDNWEDFLTVMSNSSNYVKFANPDREITGNGSSTNPFVVSTYEEMLLKTGASYIHQVKLINREAKEYKYGDIWCIYDDSLTTIDFNDIMPNGYSEGLVISAHVDYNGWTLKNITMKEAMLRMSGTENKNAIFSNLLCTGYFGSAYLYADCGFEYFIIDMLVNNASSNTQTVIYSNTNETYSIRNSALKFTLRGNASLDGMFTNCKVDLDVMGGHFDGSYFDSKNTLFTGKINTTSSDSVMLGDDIYNTIFDLEYSGNGYLSKTSYVYNASFYNSDKVSDTSHLTANNLYAATTEQLKNAEWLSDKGLPIGA